MNNELLDTIIQTAYDKGFKDGYNKAVKRDKLNQIIEYNEDTVTLKLWISPKDFLKEFDIALSTQSKMRMDNRIPYHKIGKFVRYKRTDINVWLDNAKIT